MDKLKGFRFNKALGQNFIFDSNLLKAIAADAEINQEDTVVEIGAGAGTLSAELSKKAKRVLVYEIDKNLLPLLNENLSGYKNAEIYIRDFLKLPHEELRQLAGGRFKVVANLPYYITTPLIFYFLESDLDVQSITVMVQREVAERLCAKPDSKVYGALTLAAGARCDIKITRYVGRKMFIPPPEVDSAVVNLKVSRPFNKALSDTVRCIFNMRRKTVANNLMKGFLLSRFDSENILTESGIDTLSRAEQLSLDKTATLAKNLCRHLDREYK